MARRFDFAFDARFRPVLLALGVTPAHAYVGLTDHELFARFGPWVVRTPLENVSETHLTGPYRWFRAIGPRVSLADGGLTFGTNPAAGVCILFHEPVRGIEPSGRVLHRGLTVTVADRAGLVSALARPPISRPAASRPATPASH